MKNLVKFALTLSLSIFATSGCTDDPTLVKTDKPATSMEWIIYTHNGCNGTSHNDAVHFCAPSDPTKDYGTVGAHAAQQYADLWQGACIATQGLIDTADEGHLCVVPGTLDPADFSCTADAYPTYEPCE